MFYKFSSYSNPGSIHQVDLGTYKDNKIYQMKLEDFSIKMDDYITDQISYKSKDGAMVPMTCTRKKRVLFSLDDKPPKPIPTLLYGYGGYGVVITP